MKSIGLLLTCEPRCGKGGDPTNDGIGVAHDVRRGNTQQGQSASAKPGVTPQIAAGPIAKIVRRAVDLDNETGDVAVEISDERTRRVLPSEFEATGPLPKRQPQDNFGRRSEEHTSELQSLMCI